MARFGSWVISASSRTLGCAVKLCDGSCLTWDECAGPGSAVQPHCWLSFLNVAALPPLQLEAHAKEQQGAQPGLRIVG